VNLVDFEKDFEYDISDKNESVCKLSDKM